MGGVVGGLSAAARFMAVLGSVHLRQVRDHAFPLHFEGLKLISIPPVKCEFVDINTEGDIRWMPIYTLYMNIHITEFYTDTSDLSLTDYFDLDPSENT
ncbi:hypothetical protein BTVI_69927 [Pitangus sulphuratus]|nr:hypothetical protein BTVI_69927 [Pitangus sulphuratus]